MTVLATFRLKKLTYMSAQSLKQHKLRAALSVLGVVCGVSAVFAMICVGEGAKRQALRQIEGLGMKNILIRGKDLTEEQRGKAVAGLSHGLRLDDTRRIANGLPSLERISALQEVKAPVIGAAREITPKIVAVTDGYRAVFSLNLRRGRFISNEDVARRNLVCVLGDQVAKSVDPYGTPGGTVQIGAAEFSVVGVMAPHNWQTAKGSTISQRDYNNMIFIPLGTGRDARSPGGRSGRGDTVKEIIAMIGDTSKVMASAKIIKRILMVAHHEVEDYSVIVPQELFRKAKQTHKTFTLFLGSIAGISLLVGGIGIMNIMLATVSERKREIGIRRAVGASQRHILVQFLSETVMLTSLGGALGLVTGFGFVLLIANMSGWEVAIVPWSVVLSLAMSVGVGLFFGLFPAYCAAKMDPIEALRA